EAKVSGCAREEIDLVSGLAGVGVHLLTRGDAEGLRAILELLVRLVRTDAEVPRWHTPVEFLSGPARLDYLGGLLDCGLAHGLPGARRIDGPTLWHGAGGLRQSTLRLAADTGSERLYAAAADVAVRVVDAFEADSLFGYRDLDPDGTPVDRAGLLEGAGGVVL